MVIDQRTRTTPQAQTVPALDQRTLGFSNNLAGQVRAFVLSCQVDDYSGYTIRDYKDKLGQFSRYVGSIGIVGAGDITANHVRLYLLHKREKAGPVTVRNHYRNLCRFFNWLVVEGMLDKSPMATMKPPRIPKTIIKPFTPDQIELLLAACDDRKFLGVRNKAIILMFYDTGLRLAEMAGIQIADLDMDRGIIRVMGKGARERVVGMCRKTQKALLRYLLMRDDMLPCLWLTEERRPLTHWGIEIMVQKLGKLVGLTGVRCSPHTFRHSFATHSMLNGAQDHDVQLLLGHSTLTMTQKYRATISSEDAVKSHSKFSPVGNMRKS